MTTQRVGDSLAVRIEVHLSRRDQNRVFTRGDPLITLPTTGLSQPGGGPPLERASIYLTELAGLSGGLSRHFADEDDAARFVTSVSEQLEQVRQTLEEA